MVFRAFSGDFGFVSAVLGLLLPPCTFCGLSILLWGRAKTSVFLGVFSIRVVGSGPCFLLLASCHAGFVLAPLLKMPAKKDVASSSAAEQSGKGASGVVYAERSVDKLNLRQFCERFCIPNGVSVQLVDGEVPSIEKSADNVIYFTKKQFNAGLRFPSHPYSKNFFTSSRSLRPTSTPT